MIKEIWWYFNTYILPFKNEKYGLIWTVLGK